MIRASFSNGARFSICQNGLLSLQPHQFFILQSLLDLDDHLPLRVFNVFLSEIGGFIETMFEVSELMESLKLSLTEKALMQASVIVAAGKNVE